MSDIKINSKYKYLRYSNIKIINFFVYFIIILFSNLSCFLSYSDTFELYLNYMICHDIISYRNVK
jgi:hypothetical protein